MTNCPNCGTEDAPLVKRQEHPPIVFYNCQRCDYSTWTRSDWNAPRG